MSLVGVKHRLGRREERSAYWISSKPSGGGFVRVVLIRGMMKRVMKEVWVKQVNIMGRCCKYRWKAAIAEHVLRAGSKEEES